MGKYKIFVDGSSGTTGLRIADRLAERPEFTILSISEADRKDVHARAAVINESDLSFLCLPDDAAREVVPLLRDDVRILDTSTAHRTAQDRKTYRNTNCCSHCHIHRLLKPKRQERRPFRLLSPAAVLMHSVQRLLLLRES